MKETWLVSVLLLSQSLTIFKICLASTACIVIHTNKLSFYNVIFGLVVITVKAILIEISHLTLYNNFKSKHDKNEL